MAEIRCPMCGKPNPSERETCQYCQARLKSMVDPQLPENNADEQIGQSFHDADREAEEGSVPDWLKSIREGDFLSESEEEEALPAWITGEGGGGFEEPEEAEKIEVPDWLHNLRQEGEKVQTSALSPDKLDAHPIDDEPEWLRKIRLGQQGDDIETDRLRPVIPERAAPPPVEVQPSPVTEEESSQDIPDWVAELSGKSVFTSEPPPDVSEKELPEEKLRFEHKEEDGSLLAWLSTLEDEDTIQAEPILSEKAKEIEAVDDESLFSSELSGLFDEVDTFDFDFEEETSSEAAVIQEELPEDIFPKTASPFTSEEELEQGDNIPDWLEGISITGEEGIETEAPVETEPESEADTEITSAVVPEWLEAYRPAETVEKPAKPELIFKAEKKKLEGAGPLAGLYSVLPAEPDIAKSRKPSAITDVLEITEKQRHQTSVFEELLSGEGVSGIPGEKQIIAPQNIIRIVLFLILCITIIGVRLFGINLGIISTPPSETLDAINILNAMSHGSPVLLAVDYQPGYTGEMETALSVVLDELMVKGASLAMVSTNPTGPAQIERLISQVNKNLGHQYLENEQYITLGYIAGGTTGLNGFANQPRRFFNQGADGKPIWAASWLSNINKISDFALVVVATDDPDTARAWVEQVQPSLENKPMIMVLSAQAEPMVRPYYETIPKQVSGMVTGIMGGAAFEKIINRPGVATKHWSPFNAAVMIAILLIVIGSGYSIISTLMKQRKEIAQEGRG
ncbi:MAG: hypothetical protein JW908_04175 [Anaerolineales bacterium]|nr:hypothetical protein [Anaerolineales bacterium]